MFVRLACIALLATMSITAQDRFFEMRTYYAAQGRLPDVLARFRNHTLKFFEKHGMENIGYWVPKEGPNRLVYILAYKDEAAAKSTWDAFRKDPEWLKVKSASEANGPIVEKVESVFMTPADFSKLK